MSLRFPIALCAASLLSVSSLASGQVVSSAGFSVDVTVAGGCRVGTAVSAEGLGGMMPEVTCLGNERFSLATLASGGTLRANGAPVTAVSARQGTADGEPMASGQDGDDVWMVTF